MVDEAEKSCPHKQLK